MVLEGCDRSGKSTQCSKAMNWFKDNNLPVRFFRFPGRFVFFPVLLSRLIISLVLDRTTVIGKLISSYLENKSDLDDHAIHLLFSANRWELK